MSFWLLLALLVQNDKVLENKAANLSAERAHLSSLASRNDLSPVTEKEVIARLSTLIAHSGRVMSVENPSQRVSTLPQLAPGAPPLLSFRYFEGKQRHRYGKLDLVMDDAGH
jgi:hypothetical protein